MAWQVTDPRITPPHISDPDTGDAELWQPGKEDEDLSDDAESDDDDGRPKWDRMAKDAFRDSTTYVDTNYRKKWEDSLRAFNNEHPQDSKYNMDIFRKRSHTFVPKTRAVIRKNEAAAAAAFFSNLDTVSIQAANQADQKQRLSAEVMQQIIQYRLTHTIPWFQILCGGLQDAQTQAACIAHIHWRFVARGKQMEISEDRPCIDLVPIENIRFHPAADWVDPLNASPYIIHLMPMYVGDVKDRMDRPDPKGRTWHKYPDAIFRYYMDSDDDSTRQTRLRLAEDPTKARSRISDYDVVWVHRHIHRYKGQDVQWYTLASERRLTDPEPLSRTVFHGQRPYAMGRSILETHKALPMSVPELGRGLQDDLNNTRNQRNDNVLLVLNKRYIVKRGANVDTAAMLRNVPGGITLVNDIEKDVKEQNWSDVTQSAYLEEDRITGNFDELLGNFNPMQVSQQRTPRESERTMLAVQGPSNLLTEYMLKTFVETFVLPVVRQLVLLEQHYETDAGVLTLAGEKAKVRQKFGVDEITDAILDQELTTQINVGMGATDPAMKLQRFVYGIGNLAKIAAKPPAGINLTEIYKEVFALSGYQDGSRFLSGGDPEKVQLQQQLQALQKAYKTKIGDKEQANALNYKAKHERNMIEMLKLGKQHRHEKVLKLADHVMSMDQASHQQAITPPEPMEPANVA
jgi:hypothetical protein